MNPALTAILDAIEAGTVRIRWAHDDEHAQQEGEQLLDDARTLLGMLNERVPAHTEADPLPDPYEVAERMAVPRRNCLTCQHDWRDADGNPRCVLVDCGTGDDEQDGAINEWVADDDNVTDDGHPKPDADNCPGYTLRLTDSASRNTVGP